LSFTVMADRENMAAMWVFEGNLIDSGNAAE
jgi:hypothetical protein